MDTVDRYLIDTFRESLPTQAEIDAGPVCSRCGKRCGMSREAYDRIIEQHVKTLSLAIEEMVYQDVCRAMSKSVERDPATESQIHGFLGNIRS
jgi:hypothetical protein